MKNDYKLREEMIKKISLIINEIAYCAGDALYKDEYDGPYVIEHLPKIIDAINEYQNSIDKNYEKLIRSFIKNEKLKHL